MKKTLSSLLIIVSLAGLYYWQFERPYFDEEANFEVTVNFLENNFSGLVENSESSSARERKSFDLRIQDDCILIAEIIYYRQPNDTAYEASRSFHRQVAPLEKLNAGHVSRGLGKIWLSSEYIEDSAVAQFYSQVRHDQALTYEEYSPLIQNRNYRRQYETNSVELLFTENRNASPAQLRGAIAHLIDLCGGPNIDF